MEGWAFLDSTHGEEDEEARLERKFLQHIRVLKTLIEK